MRQDNFDLVLQKLLRQRPFRPFTPELVSGARIEVNHPEALKVYPNGLLACFSTARTRSVFEMGSVVRFLTVTGTT